MLVISNLLQIAHCCRLVHERHGIEKICALPGKSNWTDVDQYRNDEKALIMADEGDLKCIFQFDSDGIRNLARSGGVTRFEDLNFREITILIPLLILVIFMGIYPSFFSNFIHLSTCNLSIITLY